VGLIQRAIEAAGIATVSVSLLRAVTEKLRVPRAVAVRWPFGHPLGEPFNRAQQLTIIHDALGLPGATVRGSTVALLRVYFFAPQGFFAAHGFFAAQGFAAPARGACTSLIARTFWPPGAS